MDGIKEDAIHNTALKLAEEIKNLSIYKSFYSDIQVNEISNSIITSLTCYYYWH